MFFTPTPSASATPSTGAVIAPVLHLIKYPSGELAPARASVHERGIELWVVEPHAKAVGWLVGSDL